LSGYLIFVKEDIMKHDRRIGAAALSACLLLAGIALAEEKTPVDPTGLWILRFGGPARLGGDSTLKVEKAGDKYVGVLTGGGRGGGGRSLPVKEMQYKDGELSFLNKIEAQGREISMEYKAKITGDTIKGAMTIAVKGQGRPRTIEFTGKRAGDDVLVQGLWKITMTLDSGQKLRPSILIKQEGGKLIGEYVGHSGQKVPIKDIKVKDGEVSFQAPDNFEQDRLVFNFAGKLKGETIKGHAKFGTENRGGNLPFEAAKSQTPTANVAGTWKLKVPTKDGTTFEPTLNLVQTGMALSGTYVGEQGDTAIRDAMVMGDEVVFEVTRERDGKKYKLRYQAKVQGDSLKGSVDYNFDGMTGFLEFEGQRISTTKAK
jgi:hypothetical protein